MKKLICVAAFLLIAAQTGSADIYFQPQFSTINVGDSITVDVMVSGMVSPWLAGYDIDIRYDPAILPLFGVAWPDDFLGISIRDATFLTGLVNVAEVSLASTADLGAVQTSGPFRIFELIFSGALAPGVSALTFDRVELTDGNGILLAPGNTPNGSVTVQGSGVVPEPGACLLLLVPAFSTVAVLRRRRRS